jgi:molybdate transport system permease protein
MALNAAGSVNAKPSAEIMVSAAISLKTAFTVTGYYLVIIFGRSGYIGKLIYLWTGWSIMFTWYAAALAAFVVAIPLLIKTARTAIESVDKNIIQASYALGDSEFQTTVYIILPLARKGILAGVILSFARALGEFGATLMIAGNIPGKTNTMPLAIYNSTGSGDWSKANMMVISLTLLSGIALYVANKYSKGV